MTNLAKAIALTLIAVVYVLFFTVGFDLPYWENPVYNAPMLTDVLIWLMIATTVGTLLLSAGSAIASARKTKSAPRQNGIPATRIAVGVAALLAASLLVSYALSSAEPVVVNGKVMEDATELKLSGTMIGSSLLMLTMATLSLLFGASGLSRRIGQNYTEPERTSSK